jgi:acetolactate synthase-1/2/3 large subunit
MGCAAIRVTRTEDVADAIAKAREINDRPVVIDFIVGEDAQVWPMIAAGASNDEIQYVKSLAPLFEPDNIAEVAEEGEQ